MLTDEQLTALATAHLAGVRDGDTLDLLPVLRAVAAAERERHRPLVEQCRAALAEELSAWDIDPPLHHVKAAHDACVAWLAWPNVRGNAHLAAAQEVQDAQK